MKSLKKLLSESLPAAFFPSGLPDLFIQGLECDSRRVGKNFLFVAIRGNKDDGNRFVNDALARGAAAVITDTPLGQAQATPMIKVPDARLAMARLAASFYDHPSTGLTVVGITGTNGKTTSSFLIEHFLRKANKNVGVVGTVNYRFGEKTIPAIETTPGPLQMQALLSEMRQASCRYVVMEVSAHALDQSRVEGIDFSTALFTNLTQDHLDYFDSLEDYFRCKARLFEGLANDRIAVLNVDDLWIKKLPARLRSRIVTFGVGDGVDLQATDIRPSEDSTVFTLRHDGRIDQGVSPLIGLHNVYNVLGSLAVVRSLGLDVAKALEDLRSFPGVPGRLERVDRGQDFWVFVDYAHTPDGLENVLRSLVPFKKRKLITLFGCGGERDKDKRPKMARIAGRYSDFVFVTSDNPRSEDPKKIASEVCSGFEKDFKNYAVVLDRRKAVRQALLAARGGDIVLLAGKGHEATQVIGKEAIPYSDREEAERVLDGR